MNGRWDATNLTKWPRFSGSGYMGMLGGRPRGVLARVATGGCVMRWPPHPAVRS
jgi:hypothetical protein